MGHKQGDAAELKRQLTAELEAARHAISREVALVQVQLNPARIAKRSMEKHRWAWVGGGVLAGVILVRLLLPPRSRTINFEASNFRSDKSGETARKRGVSAVAMGLVFNLIRRAATNYAVKHFREHALNYVDTILKRHGPPDSSTHVTS